MSSLVVFFVATVATAVITSTPQVDLDRDPVSPVSPIGLHIPWAIGGDRIERDGSRGIHPGEWPDFPVYSIRLWDTRTAWLNLEPAPDQFDFANLDDHLSEATAHGVTDVTLVLWGTPGWAAETIDANDANWLGPGSASPPQSMDQWAEFVDTVSQRYRGRINAYEIGNETNLREFWRGTDEELAAMVSTAASIIKRNDPEATVVAPSQIFTSESAESTQMQSTKDIWRELAKTPESIDALAFHWYASPATKPRALRQLVGNLKAMAVSLGLGDKPLWLTEVNRYRQDRTDTHGDNLEQAWWIERATRISKELNLERVHWYALTDLGPLDLIQFSPNSPQERALAKALKP